MLGDDNRGSDLRFESSRMAPQQASARMTRLLDVWRDQCAGLRMPPPELARFEPFAFAVGHLHLIDVRPDGSFFFRIFGTASHHPLDYHKRPTSDLRPSGFREIIESDYREGVELGEPILREITIIGARRSGSFRRVLLPYGPPDGPPTLMIAGVEEAPGITEILRDPAFQPDSPAFAAAGRA